MVTLEYKDEQHELALQVPQSWDDVTLGQYETIYAVKRETLRDKVALAAQIVGIEPKLLNELPSDLFGAIMDQISFAFGDPSVVPDPCITIDGQLYRVDAEEKLATGAWVDALQAQEEGTHVMSNILAITCRPPGEAYDSDVAEDRQKMFAGLTVTQVLPLLGFFLRCSEALEQTTRVFSTLNQLADQLPKSTEILHLPGVGTRPLQSLRAIRLWRLIRSLQSQLQKF